MNRIVTAFFYNDVKHNLKTQMVYALCFPLFTIFGLGFDSSFFAQHYFDGKQITNALAIAYFFGFFFASDLYLRKLMFVMVLLSYIGELIFCELLGMYDYRMDAIPLYVPFGHAIVYASGYVYAQTSWANENELELRKAFVVFFGVLFLSVGIFLNDLFTLFFGILFFLLLKRKRWQNLYFFIALCVVFIELVGTFFQCWKWVPRTFNLIPTSNPPMGAVFFYAGGDVLLSKIVSYWKKSN